MADIAIFRINYKSDFILTLQSDAGWTTPFCVKFWTGAPSKAYYAYYDGMNYTHCTPVEGEPTKLLVQFDDHHLPIGDLKFQIGYHFTVADFPTSVEDEVINQAAVIIDNDGERQQVMLDFNGETAPEIQFALPAYANEAQRIANEQARITAEEQRISNEEARIAAEQERQQNEQQRISREQQRIEQEQQRVNAEAERVSEFASLKTESEAATAAANIAATLANEKAQLADDKAALAQSAATLANEKAQLAEDKANLAQQKADYAQTQGNYAKAQGDAAKTEAEAAHSLNEEVSHDEATRQQQEAARQQAEAQRVIDFNAQMQQQQTAYTNAEAARDTVFDEAETERDAKVDAKVADITNLQAQIGYFICDTASATAAKTITATGYALTTGGNIRIKMTNANTADAVTLNINNTGAKALFYNGGQASSTNSWEAGEVIEVYYDGTQFQCASNNNNNNKDKVLASALNFLNRKFVGKQYIGIVSPQTLIENPKDDTVYLGGAGTYSNFGTGFTVDNGNLLVLSYENGSWSHETIAIVQSSGYEYTQEKEKTIAAALVELKLKGSGGGGDTPSSDGMKAITMKNSDTIAVIGDSYSSEDWGKPQKNWINRLSEFSDYGFMSFSLSGKTFQYMYRSVRGGGLRGKWNVVMPRYAIMCMFSNDIKVLTADQFIRSMDNICRIAEGRGCEPIIVTEHNEGTTFAQRNLYRTLVGNYAKEHNLMFWDIASIAELFSWKFWWRDTHPHALQMPIYSDNYERYINVMERPKQSIKLFNLRSEVTIGQTTPPYDSIMFTDNYQRAKLFHELDVTSNYCETLAEGNNVTIGNIALLSAVLPIYGKYCSYVALEFMSSTPPTVYVKNSVIEPWLDSGTEYIKFSFDSYTSQPQVGDVYKVTGDDSHQYTVVQFNEEDESKHTIICTPNNNDILGEYTGTLTKVSGSGDSTINFSLVQSVTLEAASLVENETCGHWQELTNIGTIKYKYELNSTQIGQCIDIDKIHFLIVSESSNVINNPTIYYKGEGDKKYIRGNMDVKSNEFNQNEELLPSSTFAAVGQTDTNWTDENGDGIIPTAMSGIESVSESLRSWAYPKGTSSVYTVTDTQTLNSEIPSNKIRSNYAVCEVWCRYVIPESAITTDSYDYNELYIKIGNGSSSNNTGVVEKRVSTFWSVVRFRMRLVEDMEHGDISIPLSLFSNSKGIEIAKVSVKYEN